MKTKPYYIAIHEPNESERAKDLCSEGNGIATIVGMAFSLEDIQENCRAEAEQYMIDCGYHGPREWLACEGSAFPMPEQFVTGFEWAGRRYVIDKRESFVAI